MNQSFQPNQQRMSELLSQVATIASVNTTCLGLARTDKQASVDADRSHNAMIGAARLSVSRLAGSEPRVKEIRSTHAQGRDVMNRHTTAWGENRRLLPNTLINKMYAEWGPIKAEHDRLVARFVADAPYLISNAQANIGTYDVEPPTTEEIEDAFSLEFKMEQVPDSANFKGNGLDAAMEKLLKERFEADIAGAYQQAQRDALTRLARPLQTLVERMGVFNQRELDKAKGLDVGREGYFRDSIIGNIQEIGSVFGSFNLTGDPFLKSIEDQLGAFDGIEADDLRNSKDLRDDTAKRAKAILDALGDEYR